MSEVFQNLWFWLLVATVALAPFLIWGGLLY